jgi:hypothetical protein
MAAPDLMRVPRNILLFSIAKRDFPIQFPVSPRGEKVVGFLDIVQLAATFCGRFRSVSGRHSSSAAQIGDLEGDRRLTAFAVDADIDLVADADLLELIGQIRQPLDRLAIDRDDDVAELPG